jgi:imidazolonepropionase-like amidohydrolase
VPLRKEDVGMDRFALVNCNLIDCVKPGAASGMTVLIRDGKITKIGTSSRTEIPPGHRVIDIGGRYLLPGLINAHTHLLMGGKPSKELTAGKKQDRAVGLTKTWLGRKVVDALVKRHAVAALNSGVTTLRAVGDLNFSDVKLRDSIAAGKVAGPRILAAGSIITPTGGHGRALGTICDSPWEVRKAARRNILEQVDLIKICSTGGVMDARRLGEAGRPEMTLEEISAACEEAHKAGLMVASHTQSAEGIRLALLGGVDSIEHGAALDDSLVELFLHNPRALRGWSSMVPTLYPALAIARLDPSLTHLKPVNIANSRLVYEGMVAGVKKAMEAGVKVGVGTDASCPFVTHYGTWRELDYLVRFAGLSPETALRNATRVNAEILGIEDVTGSIEEGKSADLIVVERNPLEDVTALSKVTLVMAGDILLEHPEFKPYPEVEKALDSIV